MFSSRYLRQARDEASKKAGRQGQFLVQHSLSNVLLKVPEAGGAGAGQSEEIAAPNV
jgi:hypothetical protein